MIHLLGITEGSEFEAAQLLRGLIVESWPWIAADSNSEIYIIAGVKCHGQNVRDLDLVVLGRFSERATYSPFLAFFDTYDNSLKKPDTIHVQSFCLVIEVKDSDPTDVRFTGKLVDVRYGNVWKSATEQSHKQVFALKNYLQHSRITPPHITNLIWLRNVENVDLPKRPHNILGGNATWDLFINVIGQEVPPRRRDGGWVIDARLPEHPNAFKEMSDLLTRTLRPTHLDRVKMDRICRAAVSEDWMNLLGLKHLIFQGRGGTGKTVILLRLAWKAYEDRNSRVLILTYNKALVADLRRLFTLMNLPDTQSRNTIQIQTIHSFLHSALQNIGFDYEEGAFLKNFEEYKNHALTYINEGAVTPSDLEELVNDNDGFKWDFIFIDEAQDWPQNERQLLRHFYPSMKFVVADGMDQLIRSETPCDWREGVPAQEVQSIKLKSCLRMKASLARFVTRFAFELKLGQWSILPNTDAPGGRVIIIEGDYFKKRKFHERLVRYNEADGNHPVDMLICIPPSLVVRDDTGKVAASIPAELFEGWNEEVWDGVAEDIRTGYPTSIKQLRIVQYDSCRGLEGWAVVNLGLDSFYDYKKALWKPPKATEPGMFTDDPELAHICAARWVMIPMTRAIDTLVIQVSPKSSPIHDALARATAACSDFVQWLKVDDF